MRAALVRGLGPALALLTACGGPALRPLASTMCHEPWDATAGGEELEEPSDAQWVALLTRDDEGPDRGCARALERLTPVALACGGEARAEGMRRIRPRVAAHHRREGMPDVVWVATHVAADGRAQGPVALVERTELGLEVQAIGGYLGPGDRVELRAYRIGAAHVVVVESSRGEERVADLLVQSGGALIVGGMAGEDGEPCRRAEIVLHRREETAPRRGWLLRSVRTATLGEGEGALLVSEHVTVRELSARDPDAPPRATHEADGVRRLTPEGAMLRADRPELAAPAAMDR